MTEIQLLSLGNSSELPGSPLPVDPDEDEAARITLTNCDRGFAALEQQLPADLLPESIDVCVHWGNRKSDATWFNSRIYVGDGDGSETRPFGYSPSILMHECAHSIITGLSATGETGAVLEHLCDVLGVQVMQLLDDGGLRWGFGHEVYFDQSFAFRHFSDPELSIGTPTVLYYWDLAGFDNKYTAASVLNHLYYQATMLVENSDAGNRMNDVWNSVITQIVSTQLSDCTFQMFTSLLLDNAQGHEAALTQAIGDLGIPN